MTAGWCQAIYARPRLRVFSQAIFTPTLVPEGAGSNIKKVAFIWDSLVAWWGGNKVWSWLFVRLRALSRKKERFQRKKSLQTPSFWKTVWYSVNKGGCKICYKVATAPSHTYFLYSSILNSWILFLSLESKSVTSRLNSSAQDMAENCYLPQVGSYFAFFRVYTARKNLTHVKL